MDGFFNGGFGGGCGCLWPLLLLCCCGNGFGGAHGPCGCDDGFGGGCGCLWPLLLLCCCGGNGFGSGCGPKC